MLGVTIMVAGAALLRIPVTRERVTVTGHGKAVRMTDTEAVRETWSAALITA